MQRLGFLLWLLACGQSLQENAPAASVAASIRQEGGREVVVLQSDTALLEVIPAEGGVCSRLSVKDGEFAFDLLSNAELLRDVFNHAAMEQDKPTISFLHQINQTAPDSVTLALTAKLDVTNSDESVAGATLEKQITLHAGKRYFAVRQVLKNTSGDVLGASLGTRNRFALSEVRDTESFLLPTERGILRIVGGGIDNFYAQMADWEYKPTDGWYGVVNPVKRIGLVFVLDRNLPDAFYTNNLTAVGGWCADSGILDPDVVFENAYVVFPLRGFQGVAHASRRLIADVQVTGTGGTEVTHTLAGGVAPLGEVSLKTQVEGITSRKLSTLPDVTMHEVGVDPATATVALPEPQQEPIVIRVTASGNGWQESYATYFEGNFRQSIYPGYPYKPQYKREGKSGRME
ncbi:MAG: hypothetical protein AUJ92_02655 [Armatimonadetes bacterium CG2_30_59_28]|nr:hypothetical protein [Armatimonadota bacterium]OIO97907.1 MAG: hypothetical protein AUJ92_02655 [Armatimonadetes bacterium CG2_30_59_28]PIU65974.1 MAG: hypothetical protein COS85_06765 [Armatimonadetes bacterium CG07_land_8_20_14_0_80_59_28]PIX38543.1 MAG: hypothetical protein COZ56_20170 [Armatimonadetes bacterium CG_4_8_14_3_um_filter_58_9]PIY43179.1 MAG: hypothetical protein COZ05_11835 [Armatimonadetes bacterium CG_4_10_14_3_um_filter_59_10]PJB76379.1 MAG: hypothetical protein CO095_026